MAVGFRFMPNKTNSEKAVLVRHVWKDQAALPDLVVTRFVATDCPTTDRHMLQELHQEVFSGHPDAGKLDVGDDVWHVYHRIGKFLTYHCAWMKPSLLALLKRGVDVGSKPKSMSIEHWQLVCAAKLEHELEKWVVEHDPNPRAAEQVEVCCKNLDNLFTHLPHMDKLALVGTTSTEHGNWVLNRRSKFVAHMRPDHTSDTVMYSLCTFTTVGLQASVVTLCSCRLISEARHKLYFLVVWIALVWPGVVKHHFCCPSCHLNVCMVLPNMRLSLVHAGFIAHKLGFNSISWRFSQQIVRQLFLTLLMPINIGSYQCSKSASCYTTIPPLHAHPHITKVQGGQRCSIRVKGAASGQPHAHPCITKVQGGQRCSKPSSH